MDVNKGGWSHLPASIKRPRPTVEGEGVVSGRSDAYLPYYKPNNKIIYSENSTNTDYKVYVVSKNNDRLGNESPIYLNHIFVMDIKGVTGIKKVNANKRAVIFEKYNAANNFINNTTFLKKHDDSTLLRIVPVHIIIQVKELWSTLSSHSQKKFIDRLVLASELSDVENKCNLLLLKQLFQDELTYKHVYKYIKSSTKTIKTI